MINSSAASHRVRGQPGIAPGLGWEDVLNPPHLFRASPAVIWWVGFGPSPRGLEAVGGAAGGAEVAGLVAGAEVSGAVAGVVG